MCNELTCNYTLILKKFSIEYYSMVNKSVIYHTKDENPRILMVYKSNHIT